MPLPRQHDVRRFQVPVDDPFLVCCLQRLCNFCGDLQDLLQRQRPPTQPVHQHFTFHVFHNYEVLTFELTDFVDVADIGMIQSRR